jgi:beta-glucosidase
LTLFRACGPVAAAVALFFAMMPGKAQKGEQAMFPYRNPKLPAEQRVEDLLQRMTLEEKVAMASGGGWMESTANERLGIPAIKMADGPVGVRAWFGPSSLTMRANSPLPVITSTAFPAGIAMGATWDPDMVGEVARTIADEAKALGRDMMLGPGVNIVRTPFAGRNFEMYGEDPYLSSRLVVAYIKAMQGEGIMATVKHFAANNQEFERDTIDVQIDERALHEIYLPAFRAAVKEAGVWAVMSAYNRVNGQWCAENPYLLNDVLKKQWGFKGLVVSDWNGTHSTAATANAGLDLEMPSAESRRRVEEARARANAGPDPNPHNGGGGFAELPKLLPLMKSGEVSTAVIDDKVRRQLRAIFANGLFDHPKPGGGTVDTPEQRAVARKAAAAGMVLLKNSGGLLPLRASQLHSLAVIGPNANVARTGGGGSSSVRSTYSVSPLEGIRERTGPAIQVVYALGCPMPGENADAGTPEARARLIQEAAQVAAKSDLALVFAGNSAAVEIEGRDRESIALPAGQDELIQAVVKANKNTIVVLNVGAPVLMSSWIGQVPAVLNAWFPGQEAGHAIADVLFGDVNPSGKLPVTFPARAEDSPSYGHYPGTNGTVEYAEGIYVGYRYFDKKNIEPLFPFGHGLSYSTFQYSGLQLPKIAVSGKPILVSMKVRNSGSYAGAEVVQLYVRDIQANVERPVTELKGFQRVMLKPGETRTVAFSLDKSALAYYDAARKEWVTKPGAFEILMGSSSRDLRLRGTFELAK